jgi:hypothetical protein
MTSKLLTFLGVFIKLCIPLVTTPKFFTPLLGVFIELCIPLEMTSKLFTHLLGVFIELCVPLEMASELLRLYFVTLDGVTSDLLQTVEGYTLLMFLATEM